MRMRSRRSRKVCIHNTYSSQGVITLSQKGLTAPLPPSWATEQELRTLLGLNNPAEEDKEESGSDR
jgi:hypothetical protein